MNIIDMFYKGGDIMWFILVGLVLEIAIIIERSIYFLLISYSYREFEKKLLEELSNKSLKDIKLLYDLCEDCRWYKRLFIKFKNWRIKNSPYYRIARVYISNFDAPLDSREEALKREGSIILNQMERAVNILNIIGHIAPLLGLLGTVTGMIKAFYKISTLGGQVDVSQLANGIWEAMITTAFGLIVAVPAYIAYDIFDKIITDKANKMGYVINHLKEIHVKNIEFEGGKRWNLGEQPLSQEV